MEQRPYIIFILNFLSFIFLLITGCGCLKGVWLKVPHAVAPGNSATLLCGYDLEGEPLYTVKWYKGKQEFFRYLPKEHPNMRVFPIEGFDVDVNASGPGRVVLREIQMDMTGKYKCEVSADAPDFHTEVVTQQMNVVHMSEGEPIMSLEKARYSLGDTLRGNCTSPPATPPANLTWLINGNKVSNSGVSYKPAAGGKSVTTARLELEVNTFMLGKIKITCVADVFGVYVTQTEVILDEERPRLAPVVGTNPGHCVRSISWLIILMVIQSFVVAR